ncbi:poly polymerase [Trichonephila clavipes]|nr:poly polymerase [Trichonephila clavipes]
MIPAYNKMRCAAFPFETGIHYRRKTDFFPEEDTTKSYSGFEPEPTRLQTEEGAGNAVTRELTKERGIGERTRDAEVDNPGLKKERRER